MGAFAILQALSSLGQSTAKAKQELSAEDIARQQREQQARQVYSQLETAAVQREHLKKIIEQMSANPEAKHIADIESAIGRKLTDAEKQRFFGVAPKETTGKVATKLVQDKNSSTGWSFISYDPISGQEYSRQLDAPPQRGLIESETTTTDPFGFTSVSHRKPIIGGTGGGAKGKPAVPATTSPAGPLAKPVAGKAGASSASAAPSKFLPLDAEGHIPANPLINPHIREAANELLDGQDKLKIQPSRLADAAATLARRYGWEQGKFTPKEQMMLRETTTFIGRMLNSGSLKALDSGVIQRFKTSQAQRDPEKEGMFGRFLTIEAATNLDPVQANFVREYNQLIGSISGMSQLVRPGRPTEAGIRRLMLEAPNILQAKDSADGEQRLRNMLKEINIALQKGQFSTADTQTDPHAMIQQILQKRKGASSASPR